MKSHWIITYVMADSTRIRENTRDAITDSGPMPEMTEDEVRASLPAVLLEPRRHREDPARTVPMAWVRDQARGNLPTLLMIDQVLYLELEPEGHGGPEPDLKEEADRHLELVRDLDDPTLRETMGLPPELGTARDLQRTMDPGRVRRVLGGRGFRGLEA